MKVRESAVLTVILRRLIGHPVHEETRDIFGSRSGRGAGSLPLQRKAAEQDIRVGSCVCVVASEVDVHWPSVRVTLDELNFACDTIHSYGLTTALFSPQEGFNGRRLIPSCGIIDRVGVVESMDRTMDHASISIHDTAQGMVYATNIPLSSLERKMRQIGNR
jgi:hypothetical protein